MRWWRFAGLLLLTPAWLSAQQLQRPAGWRVVTDRPAPDTAVYYVTMVPGWHMTTGPGSLLFDPAHRAKGRYSVEAEIFLFAGTSQEGYGVFLGGAGLEGKKASYVAFLARRDGSAAVLRHAGGVTTPLVDWSSTTAVAKHTGGDEPVKNVLRVSVGKDSVSFDANGTRVASVLRAGLQVDGSFGFRVGEDVNLHASRLDLIQPLAPSRR